VKFNYCFAAVSARYLSRSSVIKDYLQEWGWRNANTHKTVKAFLKKKTKSYQELPYGKLSHYICYVSIAVSPNLALQ
jgi:hypothetical protein